MCVYTYMYIYVYIYMCVCITMRIKMNTWYQMNFAGENYLDRKRFRNHSPTQIWCRNQGENTRGDGPHQGIENPWRIRGCLTWAGPHPIKMDGSSLEPRAYKLPASCFFAKISLKVAIKRLTTFISIPNLNDIWIPRNTCRNTCHIKALVITVCSNDQGTDLLQGWLLGLFSEV